MKWIWFEKRCDLNGVKEDDKDQRRRGERIGRSVKYRRRRNVSRRQQQSHYRQIQYEPKTHYRRTANVVTRNLFPAVFFLPYPVSFLPSFAFPPSYSPAPRSGPSNPAKEYGGALIWGRWHLQTPDTFHGL